MERQRNVWHKIIDESRFYVLFFLNIVLIVEWCQRKIFTALSKLHEVLFLALSVTSFCLCMKYRGNF